MSAQTLKTVQTALQPVQQPPKTAIPENPVVMIPARMASTRLPNKPLADINGLPMIAHVMRRAAESKLGRVVVACSEPEVRDAIESFGGIAIMTDPDLPSGSDRILQALQIFDTANEFDAVINVQGDLPTIDPHLIHTAFDLIKNPETDIGTLAAVITKDSEKTNPNVVKAITNIDFNGPQPHSGQAFYFSRATAPYGDGVLLHHIGLYAYKRTALETFVAAQPAVLEQREKLEQLRALALGMRIDVAVVDTVPLGVDTPHDLETARDMLTA